MNLMLLSRRLAEEKAAELIAQEGGCITQDDENAYDATIAYSPFAGVTVGYRWILVSTDKATYSLWYF
jgi:hypothetical protein